MRVCQNVTKGVKHGEGNGCCTTYTTVCVCNVVEFVVTVVIARSNDESVAIVTAANVCNIKSQ